MKKTILFLLTCLVAALIWIAPAYGAIHTEFKTIPTDKETKDNLCDSLRIKKLPEYKQSNSAICGVDINCNNEIAIAFQDKHIEVYDTDGNFLYGYQMRLTSDYEIIYDLNDNQLMIYIPRSYALIKLNK